MKPPLICAEGLDISIHDSARNLCTWVEAVDVEAAIYECFDSDGLILDLKVVAHGVVELRERQPRTEARDRLVALLSASLRSRKRPVAVDGLSLEALVELARDHWMKP